MCCGCWEKYGSHAVDNPKVRAWALAHGAIDPWGPCHIVVEDDNVEDEHLDFCLKQTSPAPDALERSFLLAGLSLSLEERASVVGLVNGCWTAPNMPDWFQ